MDVVGTGLSILSTIDLCLKYGEALLEACRIYKHAEAFTKEQALRVEVCCKRMRDQLRYIRAAMKDFDDEFIELQSRMLNVLEVKLLATKKVFDKVHDKALNITKWRVVTVKETLDKAIVELEEWQARFDTTWLFVLKIASRVPFTAGSTGSAGAVIPTRDVPTTVHLRTAGGDGLKPMPFFAGDRLAPEKIGIANSTMQLRHEPGRIKMYLVESIACDAGVDANILAKDVRKLATKLNSENSDKFSILRCKGAIRNKQGSEVTSFELIFRLPNGVIGSPQSFRDLIGTKPDPSLSERLILAQQLSRAVCYIHTLDFVHKRIRPEAILTYRRSGSKLGPLFLAGFQRFRSVDGRTVQREQSKWDIDLYCHPNRQGEHPEEAYTMQHDMYSLGVCLLEIGLWTSFVVYESNSDTPTPSAVLDIAPGLSRRPNTMKKKLVSLAREALPCRMGDRFTAIVLDCLTCLDPENEHFADPTDFEDEDGILIGVKYIEKILLELSQISL